MKVKMLGTALVVTTDVEVSKLGDLEQFAQGSLELKDEKGNVYFRMAQGSKASFTSHGAVFNDVDGQGRAQMTLEIPAQMTDSEKKEFVRKSYGNALLSLNALEEQIAGASAEVSAKIEEIDSLLDDATPSVVVNAETGEVVE